MPAPTSSALSSAGSAPRTTSRVAVDDARPGRRAAARAAAGPGCARRSAGRRRAASASSSCSTSRPRSSTPTRVHSCSTSASRWLDRKTVVPPRVQLEQQLADLADALRVQAVGRLVEDQQLRTAQQRAGQPEPLAHAERVGLHRPAADAGRGRPAPAPRRPAGRRGAPRPAAGPLASSSGRLLPAGQVPVVPPGPRPARRPGGSTRRPARGIGSPSSSICAAGGQHQAEQHPHRRGLARAVGAEEAVDVAGADVEVDARRRR